MSCQNEVVAYRIVYMALFLYFTTTFQVRTIILKIFKSYYLFLSFCFFKFCYRFWRLSIYAFHFIVVIYSMLVLVLLYAFQFDYVYNFVKNKLKLSDDSLKSIGFEKFAKSNELVLPLLTPTTFLIVNILQINYFNKPWFDLTEIKPM